MEIANISYTLSVNSHAASSLCLVVDMFMRNQCINCIPHARREKARKRERKKKISAMAACHINNG
jgi:hypothetical protein